MHPCLFSRDAGKSMVDYKGIEWSRILRHVWKRGELGANLLLLQSTYKPTSQLAANASGMQMLSASRLGS